MDEITKHVLAKLDLIREDQIRELERVDEIRFLLRNQVAPAAAPATITGLASSQLERWIFSLKPLAAILAITGRQIINTMIIIYMARGGSLGPAEPYIRYLIGIP